MDCRMQRFRIRRSHFFLTYESEPPTTLNNLLMKTAMSIVLFFAIAMAKIDHCAVIK